MQGLRWRIHHGGPDRIRFRFRSARPNGIRPAYFYADDEVVVVASEKPAIKTAFNIEYSQIEEIRPGHAPDHHQER